MKVGSKSKAWLLACCAVTAACTARPPLRAFTPQPLSDRDHRVVGCYALLLPRRQNANPARELELRLDSTQVLSWSGDSLPVRAASVSPEAARYQPAFWWWSFVAGSRDSVDIALGQVGGLLLVVAVYPDSLVGLAYEGGFDNFAPVKPLGRVTARRRDCAT